MFERRMIVAMGADLNEAREELPSVIQSLPRRLRESNAAQFLGIVEELRRSFVLELELAQRVSRVNVEDPPAVTQLRWTLEDYAERRLFDRDRTHCSNIGRVAREIRAEQDEGGANLDRLSELLTPLTDADVEFVDDVEQLVATAVSAVREIDDAKRLDDARAAQKRFRERMESYVERDKRILRRMNDLAGELLDLL